MHRLLFTKVACTIIIVVNLFSLNISEASSYMTIFHKTKIRI